MVKKQESTKKNEAKQPKHKKVENKKQKKESKKENKEKIEVNPSEYSEIEENQILEDINILYKTKFDEVQSKLNLDKKLLTKAIANIKKLISAKYSDKINILSNQEDEYVYLNFVFSKLPFKYSIRPCNIQLPHSIYSQKYNSRVCLFVKDPRSAFKDLNLELPFDIKVLDIEKLKLKFSRFNERRNLLKQYDIFLCDYKIYFLLKKLLGKPFYVSKKYPIPLKLDYNDTETLKNEIVSHYEKSTTFYMSNGPNYSIKISRAVFEEDKLVDNIIEATKKTIPHILKWGINFEDLKSISVKGTNTIDFPIFNQLTEEEIKNYLN